MEWHDLVILRLSELGRLLHQPPRFLVYPHQCYELVRQLSTKLAKFWTIRHTAGVIHVQSPNLHHLQHCSQALKEVHRVLMHALSFLHSCASEYWLEIALYKADTNEALLVHIHDLLWCVVGLDVCLHIAKGNSMESCSELLARRVRDCSQELESLAHRHDLLEQDVQQLLEELHSIVYSDRENGCWCTLRSSITKSLTTDQRIALHTKRTLLNGSVDMRCLGVKQLEAGSVEGVLRASWLGLPVALKCFPQETTSLRRTFPAPEQCRFKHPFIIRTFGFCSGLGVQQLAQKFRTAYVMQLMPRNLRQEIRRWSVCMETEEPGLPLAVAVDVMLQISRGMEYLHEFGVLHRDIKPTNILVETSGERLDRIRISDFDVSVAIQDVSRDSSVVGTRYFIAPEYVTTGFYSRKTDVYSFAITCSEILTGKPPFEGVQLNMKKMHQFITQRGERPALPLNCPLTLAAFISRCWDDDPARRPDFREISKFLRQLKLVLMRVDDPNDFMVSLTEFDRKEFEMHLHPSPLEPSRSLRDPPLASGLQGIVANTEKEKTEEQEISKFLSSATNYKSDEDELSSMPKFIWQMSLEDLSKATNNFSHGNRLGRGSYAEVYKGVLPNGRQVAVKRLNAGTAVFRTEARASAQVTHPNVIRLLGLCDHHEIKLLVYDYMVHGSLDKVLFITDPLVPAYVSSPSALNWKQRCKIALGIAHGLAYLHEDCEDCILHFDVKAGNTLLDHDLQPKLCDFGVSELVQHTTKTFISFERRGTRGYMAPEIRDSMETGTKITDSADVYSFGMLLFEIVRGQRNFQRGCEEWTPSKASEIVEEKRIEDMMDPHLLDLPHQEIVRPQVEMLVKIALQTCEADPASRPHMSSVALKLEHFITQHVDIT